MTGLSAVAAPVPAPPMSNAEVAAIDMLLSYQQERVACEAQVIIDEKSRRIGASWGAACKAVLKAAAKRSAGGDDVLYIGYNLEMAREFIGDVAFWARAISAVAEELEVAEFVFVDKDDHHGDRSIQAFRVRFASGFEVVALSSRPRSLRGKQGLVIIDEAAFHDDLPGLMKAAMALLIWGGAVIVISTHDGDDNPFNELVQDTRDGKTGYKLFRTTFDDAIEAGLYRRICMRRGETWTAEGEAKWREDIRKFYRDDAAEELDVIPSSGKGSYLTRAMVLACMDESRPVLRLVCKKDFEQEPDAERAAFVDAWIREVLDPHLVQLDKTQLHYYGQDFGRDGDLSVIWPYAMTQGVKLVCPFAVELRRVPFREQERILFHLVDRLPRFMSGAMDARGNGQFLAEVAMQRYGALRIARIMASQTFYAEWFPKLKAAIEDRTVTMPRDMDILGDHRMVRVIKGTPKVPDDVRRRGADGFDRHGDSVIADLLAFYASEMDVPEIEFQSSGVAHAAVEALSGYGGFGHNGGPRLDDYMGG